MDKKNDWWKSVALLLISVIIFICLFEIGLRIFLPQNLRILQFNPYVEHELIPGKEGVYSSPQSIFNNEFFHSVKISKQGLREDRIYSKNNTSSFRIAVLGSSGMFGFGVESNETFSKILEKKLQQNGDYEVLNFGVPAYSPDNELLLLMTKVVDYNPDIVIMEIPILNIASPLALFDVKNGGLVYSPVNAPSLQLRFRQFLMKHSHSWSFMVHALNSNTITKYFLTKIGIFVQERSTLFGQESYESYKEKFKLQSAIVLKASEYCKSRNISFLVVIEPMKEQVDERKFSETTKILPLEDFFTIDSMEEDFYNYLSDKSIHAVKLSDKLKKENINNSFFYEMDGHMNKKGHEIFAEIVYANLFSGGFL